MATDSAKAEQIALQLMDKFNNDKDRLFYLKVGHRINEQKIWLLYEQALKGKYPIRLFNYLCKREMDG